MSDPTSKVVNPEPLLKQMEKLLKKYPPSDAYKNVKPKVQMAKIFKSSNNPSSERS